METTQSTPLSLATKLGYGTGGIAVAVKDITFAQFILFYYSQVMGLSAALCGTALFIATLVDAVTDPMVGYVSDRSTLSRGRRHPFMFASIIPSCLMVYALLSPPAELSQTVLFCWLLLFSIGVRFVMTWFFVPYMALGAELSTDYDERTVVAGYRYLFMWIGGAGISMGAYAAIFRPTPAFENGLMDPGNYQLYALVSITMILFSTLWSSVASRHYISYPDPQSDQDNSTGHLLRFITELKVAFSNRNFRVLMLGSLIACAIFGINWAFFLYINTYFWELESSQIAVFPLAGLIAVGIGFSISKPLGEQFEKRSIVMGTLLFMTLSSPLAILLRINGFFPENGSPYLLPLIAFLYSFYYIGTLLNLVFLASMLADTLDEQQYQTGKRQEGIFFSAFTFCNKASSSLGPLIVGILLELIEFPAKAEVENIPAETINHMGYMAGPLVAIFFLFAAWVISRYQLDRRAVADIRLKMASEGI